MHRHLQASKNPELLELLESRVQKVRSCFKLKQKEYSMHMSIYI